MTVSNSSPIVGIIGSGTMGAGIAQVAAVAGWEVQLLDVDEATVAGAITGIGKRLDRLVEKERITGEERDAAAARLHVAGSPAAFASCELVVEAIVEDLDTKTRVLGGTIGELRDDAIIASNTSSLSISALGDAIGQPARTVGMHFFNPAPIMRLVEVIAGAGTDAAVVDRTAAIAESWGKRVARAADVPGFIVNHVARPYYLEAFRILSDGLADPATIDRTMREHGGFRMGPLELTDLIGQDVNTATTRSVWEQLDRPPLLEPSPVQEQLVAEGHLGRKTKRGVYDYAGDEPAPALTIEPRPLELGADIAEAVERFVAGTTDTRPTPLEGYVLARDRQRHHRPGARRARARRGRARRHRHRMRFGVNYPRGPYEWRDGVGEDVCRALVSSLHARA